MLPAMPAKTGWRNREKNLEGGSMMKRLTWMPLIALLLGLAMLIGCGEKAEEAAKKVSDKTLQTTEAAKKTMESATAWTKDKMDAYVGEMKEQLGKYDTQFEDLSAKAEKLGDDAKEKFKGQLVALTEKKEAIAKKMEELQGASGEAWVKAKQELDKLMAELSQFYENIKKDFSTT
jgi:uncharacterized protein YdeI (BOF family)